MSTSSKSFNSKSYLITGGAGFIGSNIASALSSNGADIIISDRFRSGDKWKNVRDLAIKDIVCPTNLREWLELNGSKLSAIIHMGAVSATTENDVDKIIENNFHLSTYLWNVSAKLNLQFIYASSAATYGNGEVGFEDIQTLQHMSKLRPLNPYGWSKLLVDKRILLNLEQGLAKPIQWAGLKFFNVYGPNENHKGDMRSVVNKIYPLVKSGQEIELFRSYNLQYPDGGQLRDFIYVKDCIKVILWLLQNPQVSGIFNVGTGKPRSFLDLVGALDKVVETKSKINYVNMPESIKDRYQYYTCANMSKLYQAGYAGDFMSLEDGVSDYFESYLSQYL